MQAKNPIPFSKPIVVILAASYLNFLVTNSVVVGQKFWESGAPESWKKSDEKAEQILQSVFPHRKIVMLHSRSINIGGGGIHCITQPMPQHNPEIITIPEMRPWKAEYDQRCTCEDVDKKIIEEFQEQWKKSSLLVEKKINHPMLLSISLWAKEQMKEFVLPCSWISTMDMEVVASSQDKRYIIFSQQIEKGYPLPSHNPVVFRRIILGVVYDTIEKNIPKVFVTVRGWKEE
jgi:hypothetical protein